MISKDSIKDALLYIDNKTSQTAKKNAADTTTYGVKPPVATLPTGQEGQAPGGASDYYSQLMAAIDMQAKAKRDAQISALDAQLKRGLSDYDAQLSALEPIYQNYRNQSEVERYKAQRALRESQANRGALDSGVGRQEALDLQTNYGNNLNAINLQYQAEIDAINRAKQALKDEAYLQRANIEADNVASGLQDEINALKSQLSAQSAASRKGASDVVDKAKNAALSNNGQTFLNTMLAKANIAGRNLTQYEVQQALKNAYEQDVLSEDDVKLIKQKYGY